jgi:rhodanese-related sulfurtransferase
LYCEFFAFFNAWNSFALFGRLKRKDPVSQPGHDGGAVVTEGSGYAGDVEASDAWAALAENPAATLVDVRTVPEWSFVGIADLSEIAKSPVLIEWQSFPSMQANEQFVAELAEALQSRGASRDAPLYFLCRSGVRSRAAAIAATLGGWTSAFNILDGFEGPLGPDRRRGHVGGWKAKGMPWIQS